MKNEKSYFEFKYNGDVVSANNAITSYLTSNGFEYMDKGDAKYWRKGNPLVTKSFCIEYFVKEKDITINAYYNTPKKPQSIESQGAGSKDYIKASSTVQKLIDSIMQVAKPTTGVEKIVSSGALQANIYEEMEQQTNYQNGKLATLSLVVGIINTLCIILFQAGLGLIFLVPLLFLAISGLKSKKSGAAIFGIVFMVIGIAFCIYSLYQI